MNIGIIGSGKIGATAARLFVHAGHQVAISNSRGPASLASLVKDLPVNPLAGKVVVDAMNYCPQRDGRIELGELTSTELVSRHLRGARLVKAFNTMYFETLGAQGRGDAAGEDRLALFVAGDDAEAKAMISRLIEEIGFAPVDTGSLHDGGRLQQPGSRIYNQTMTAREARTALSGLR